MQLGKLGVWASLDHLSLEQSAHAAAKIEALGYGTYWMPESLGYDPLVLSSWLLNHTKTLNVATGILNIYRRDPLSVRAAKSTLAQASSGRFLLGLGVSHKALVEGFTQHTYGPPVKAMRNYLEAIDSAPFLGQDIVPDTPRVIAALGPKMLELAAETCQGAHPYFTTPEHTARARSILGPDAWLCVEQKVILETNPVRARQQARPLAQMYTTFPNYQNSWKSLGLSEQDIEQMSDKFVDSTFAWGSAEAIQDRLQQHFDAGASHVCIQPVHPGGVDKGIDWNCLETLATA